MGGSIQHQSRWHSQARCRVNLPERDFVAPYKLQVQVQVGQRLTNEKGGAEAREG